MRLEITRGTAAVLRTKENEIVYTGSMFKTGMIVQYAGVEAPDGWLFCDGSAIPDGDEFDGLRERFGDVVPDLSAQTKGLGVSVTHSESVSHTVSQSDGVGVSRNQGTSETRGVSHTHSEGSSCSTSSRSSSTKSVVRYIIKV